MQLHDDVVDLINGYIKSDQFCPFAKWKRRKHIMRNVENAFQTGHLKPTNGTVRLHDQSLVTIPVFDIKHMILNMLTDPTLMQEHNLVSGYNIFTGEMAFHGKHEYVSVQDMEKASEVLVQVSYAIGVAKPTSINVNTYGTAKVKLTDGQIGKIVEGIFDMRPYFIEQRLKLRTPMYSETAAYGHMGRKNETVTKTFTSPDGKTKTMKVELFTWEKLDYVAKVKKAFGLK